MAIGGIVNKAFLINENSSLLSLSLDGVEVTAFDELSTKPNSKSQLKVASDFFLQAVTPDKTVILGSSLGVAGAVAGVVSDLLEAVPAAVVGAAHLGAAAVKGGRSALGWDAE